MARSRRPSDSEEDMPYINFDQKPVWNNEKFPMTNWMITLPLKNGQQTRERFTVMTSHSSCFPVTEFVQPPDSNMHAVKNITETDVAKSSDADKGRCPANDHQPKAKAQKLKPPLVELSSEQQQRNSDVDKFLFTLMLSSEP